MKFIRKLLQKIGEGVLIGIGIVILLGVFEKFDNATAALNNSIKNLKYQQKINDEMMTIVEQLKADIQMLKLPLIPTIKEITTPSLSFHAKLPPPKKIKQRSAPQMIEEYQAYQKSRNDSINVNNLRNQLYEQGQIPLNNI